MRLEHRASPDDVRSAADAICAAIIPRWMVDRQVRGGKPIPTELGARVQRVADTCNSICAQSPIPVDYRAQLEEAGNG